MKPWMRIALAALVVLGVPATAWAKAKVTIERQDAAADGSYKFEKIPQPAKGDDASEAEFTIIDGRRDPNGGELAKLHDGALPVEADEPAENFFFNAGDEGGRLLVNLGRAIEIKQVNTYSWHPGTRGPQVFKLYASDGSGEKFDRAPRGDVDPTTCGWTLLGDVDARAEGRVEGGQYGVSIANDDGTLGSYRYLLFSVTPTEQTDPFGNTFFSEIDVVSPSSRVTPATRSDQPSGEVHEEVVEAGDGKYRITIETTEAPDLTKWVHDELAPVVREWYPKIVDMLPSDGYEAPTRVRISFNERYRGVAATSGTRIECAARWFRGELNREAKGAVVHELVHVAQQYGQARRRNPDATRTPGWLVEGIPDYIRWFLYEPQSHGAEISSRNIDAARYDASYRITANFLNWTVGKHGADLVPKLNAAAREGRYNEELWEDLTGSKLEQLADDWKVYLQKQTGDEGDDSSSANALTDEEKAAGWVLLFNGRNEDGWHSFRQDGVRPGWQVKDGALVCADPHDAGDLCTDKKYDAFELQLEYNISEGGNSGIMYHVTDEAGSAWGTGPEFQLEDNAKAADPIRCGWLYALYEPPLDAATGKPRDATKPAGQWNRVRLLITPEKCEHEINGVKYFDYVIGSEDFNQRVANSKFGSMPHFAKSNEGYIALQGDHGQVSFRNIKVRPIAAKK